MSSSASHNYTNLYYTRITCTLYRYAVIWISIVCHFCFIQSLQNEIIYISRPIDKKKIVFYNDKTAALPVDEEFQKLWRSVAVESMDDQKIEEYLEKQVSNIHIP